MRRVGMALSLLALGCVLASCNKPPAPKAGNAQVKSDNEQYMRGYRAGRRDERRDLCNKFEQHKAGVAGALGAARMGLIHTFCLMQL